MEINKMVLDQHINMLEAAQCIVKLFEFSQLYDQGEIDQERIHLILAQMCMGYHSNDTLSPRRDPSLSVANGRKVSLRHIMDYCKDHSNLNSKDVVKWLRDSYDLRCDLTLYKLQDLGLFGHVLGLFYGSLLQTNVWTGEWIFDSHSDCIVVPTTIRKHLLTNHREQWSLYGTELKSTEIIIGNAFKPKGTVFDVGVF